MRSRSNELIVFGGSGILTTEPGDSALTIAASNVGPGVTGASIDARDHSELDVRALCMNNKLGEQEGIRSMPAGICPVVPASAKALSKLS
jgi:hypothetical protein